MAKCSPCVFEIAHGIDSLPWLSLPCVVCREQTHGVYFAVRFCYFAVCRRHTAKQSFLVVIYHILMMEYIYFCTYSTLHT
jgi:hypothetical protein